MWFLHLKTAGRRVGKCLGGLRNFPFLIDRVWALFHSQYITTLVNIISYIILQHPFITFRERSRTLCEYIIDTYYYIKVIGI